MYLQAELGSYLALQFGARNSLRQPCPHRPSIISATARRRGMPKGGCRARWTFRSTISAASRRRMPARCSPNLLRARWPRQGRSRLCRQSAGPCAHDHGSWCARCLGLPAGDYALDDRLREIGYGEWEGSTLAQMQAKDPVLYARRLTAKVDDASPGGETYAAVQLRMRDWYDSRDGATPSLWPMAAPRGR